MLLLCTSRSPPSNELTFGSVPLPRAFTFPLGVFATSTTALAKELNSPAFKVLGTILSAAVVALWLVVMGLTIQKAWVGTL